jgi:hypothetical protein
MVARGDGDAVGAVRPAHVGRRKGGATWVKVGRPKILAIRLVHQGSWATKGFGPKAAIKKRIHFFLFGFYSNNFDSDSNDL